MAPRNRTFRDRLQATLSFSIGSETIAIPAGSMDSLELHVRAYAFDAEISFRISLDSGADDLWTPFQSTDLIQATLAVANGRLALGGEVPVVSSFCGYVTGREVEEITSEDLAGDPIVERRYTVRIADAAQVFWRAHRPLGVYANQSIQDVIDRNTVQGMTLAYDLPQLALPRAIIALGRDGVSGASFYDFVVGVVSDLSGVIELEAGTGTYRIGREKSREGEPTDLDAESVARLCVQMPRLLRNTTAVLDPFTEAPAPKSEVSNSVAATGVRRDVLCYTPIPAVVDQRVNLERSRLGQPDNRLDVTFGGLPPAFPIPGALHTIGEGFSKRLLAYGKTYRSTELLLHASLPERDKDPGPTDDDSAVFDLELEARYERDSDPVPNLPSYVAPVYPVRVEGKVLSASGTESDRTWQALEGSDDSVIRYRVHIPLWNQTIVVPFEPYGESGHFFFPCYKNQRVLVELDFEHARIVGVLDWASKLAAATQGNQIVMGKGDTSGTVLKHVYTDDSPVWTLARTSDGDKQTLELSDGKFFLEVREDTTQAQQESTYDLTPQADMAKEAAQGQVQSSVGVLSGKFEASMGGASGGLRGASGEVQGHLDAATGELSGKISATETQLSTQATDTKAAAEALSAKVIEAKAALDSLLEDD